MKKFKKMKFKLEEVDSMPEAGRTSKEAESTSVNPSA
jgi:hypothetical protein